ncbi:hypothetical protein EPB68_03710 [Enterococcus faecalis]|nr:hypothetical protein EPB68_03710 [Enterococcus faecalis]
MFIYWWINKRAGTKVKESFVPARLFNDGWLLLEKFSMNIPIASIFGFFQCLHSTEANRMIR